MTIPILSCKCCPLHIVLRGVHTPQHTSCEHIERRLRQNKSVKQIQLENKFQQVFQNTVFRTSSVPPFLPPSLLPSFLCSFLPSFLPSFFSSFLPSLPSFLPTFLPSRPFLSFSFLFLSFPPTSCYCFYLSGVFFLDPDFFFKPLPRNELCND